MKKESGRYPLVLAALLSISAAGLAAALAVGTASANAELASYIVTIKSLELKNNAGAWIMIVEPDHPVDVIKNEPSVSFFNNGKVPAGEYVNFRLSISDTVKVSGHDGELRTRESGSITVGFASKCLSDTSGKFTSIEETAPTAHTGEEGAIRVKYCCDGRPGDGMIRLRAKKDFEPIAVGKGTFLNVSFTPEFNRSLSGVKAGSLGKDYPPNDVIIAMPPATMAQTVVTVDQESKVFQGDDLVVEF